jgi:hypothetical protein
MLWFLEGCGWAVVTLGLWRSARRSDLNWLGWWRRETRRRRWGCGLHWHVHLTPTSSSWLNQVERFFALITDKKIRRGVHHSVAALTADIKAFIASTTAIQNPSAGPGPPTTSSPQSSAPASKTLRYSHMNF